MTQELPDLDKLIDDARHSIAPVIPITGDDWTDPIPLGDTDDQPPFPIHVFPPVVADYIRTTADDLQVSPDLPAMLAVGTFATLLAGHYRVQVTATWHESLNVYLVSALPPGAGKSPAVKAITGQVDDHEIRLREEAETRKDVVDQKRRMIASQMKKAEDRGDHVEAAMHREDLANTPPVVIPRIIADDATPEALTALLADQGGRMAVISTEGGPFDMMAGRYSDAANLDVYLKGWSGDAIRTDRVGRGATTIKNPLLTVMLTVQPSVIESLATKPEFRGRGLTTRFMYSVPVDRVGYRDMSASARSDPAIRAAYETFIRQLIHQHANLPDEPAVIAIHPDAWADFVAFRQGLEDRRRPAGDLRPLAEWTTKLESTVARLAGILAVLDGQPAITGDVMRRAIMVGHYWLAHAKIVHDMWGTDERVVQARKIVEWVSERELRTVSVRDLQTGLRRLFATAEDTKPALNLLIERGWLRPQFDGPIITGRRGKPSPAFDTHPNLWTTATHVSHVSHVSKDLSSLLSIYLEKSADTDPRTHDSHETHESPPTQPTIPADFYDDF